MENQINVMVDIETLGTGSDATILQISAISFDIATGKHTNTFNEIADITKNKNMVVDGSTLKWWLNTDRELLSELINKGGTEGDSGEQTKSSDEVLSLFGKWLRYHSVDYNDMTNIYLWGNGILFDNKMLQQQMRDYPIFYKNDRDVRTIVDLASKKLKVSEKELKDMYNDDTLVKHNAFDDVKYQIKLVTGCYNALMK